jgi:hypothetical protein
MSPAPVFASSRGCVVALGVVVDGVVVPLPLFDPELCVEPELGWLLEPELWVGWEDVPDDPELVPEFWLEPE